MTPLLKPAPRWIIGLLRQAGTDLLERIAAASGPAAPDQAEPTADLDAQVAALRQFCQELKALYPALYQQLAQEVKEAVRDFTRAAKQKRR